MYAKNRISSRKKYIAPAIIGAGIGVATSLIGAAAAKKRRKEEERKAQANILSQEIQQDKMMLEDEELEGQDGVEYYAKGGELKKLITDNINNTSSNGGFKTQGGKLLEIGEGVELAVGNKHSEKKVDGTYGIKLYDEQDPNPDADAEIEDGEVVVDGKAVMSDQLMYDKKNSYADMMIKLTKKRNRKEKELSSLTKSRARNTKEKEMADLNMAEESLFQDQERKKLETGKQTLDNLKYGGTIKKYKEGGTMDFVNKLAPKLIDNAVNLGLTLNTPTLDAPRMAKAKRLKTKVNVNPQLASVRRSTKAVTDNALNNTSSSSVARNAIARAQTSGAEQEANIQANKENVETQLVNRNRLNSQNVSNQNTQLVNRNLKDQYTRQADIQSKISANAANLSEDIGDVIQTNKLDTVEDEKLLLDLMNDKTGAKLRALENDPYIEERLKKNPKLRQAINSLRINKGAMPKYEDADSSLSYDNTYV